MKNRERTKTIALCVVIAIISVAIILGYLMKVRHRYQARERTYKTTVRLVSKKYHLTDVRSNRSLDTNNRKVSYDSMCHAVNTTSPTYLGVYKGQQITFRAGMTDCNHPDPQIIIVTAPNNNITPQSLEKNPQ